MREIKISITKAHIRSYSVDLQGDFPVVTATIDLRTDGGKSIATYSIASDHWEKDLKFDLPVSMVFPIKDIAAQLEEIVARHCEYSTLRLTAAPRREIIEPIPLAAGEDEPF